MASCRIFSSFSRFSTDISTLRGSVNMFPVKLLKRSINFSGYQESSELANKELNHIESSVPDIPAFYRGKSVFITGGTGFMGKVLVERLLATCPDIGNLYLLMREKKDLTPERRLEKLKHSKVFEVLRAKNPRQLDKIVAISTDMSKPHFGFSTDVREKLNEVSVIFHAAASLSMMEPLRDAVRNNLRLTMDLLALGDTLPKLEVFIYVSTIYSNQEFNRIEEKVYPPPMELKTLLDLVDNQNLNYKQEKKTMGVKSNSYVFTKSMAEHEVARHRGSTSYPIAVFRPGIVISSVRDPFPGWIENMNGASGVIANVCSGVLRVFQIRGSARADLVPVDIVIDTLIAAGWEMAVDKPDHVRVYNSTVQESPIRWWFFRDAVNELAVKYPSLRAATYPRFHIHHNRYLQRILEILLQIIPIYLIDYTMTIFNRKYNHRLIAQMKKAQEMGQSVYPFITKDFEFENKNVQKLRSRLSEKDKMLFNLDPMVDWHEVMLTLVRGTRRHVLREPDHTLADARARVRKMGYGVKAAQGGVGILTTFKLFSDYFK